MEPKAPFLHYLLLMIVFSMLASLAVSCDVEGEVTIPITSDTASADNSGTIDLTESEATDSPEAETTAPEDTTVPEIISTTTDMEIRTPTPKILDENQEIAVLYNQILTDESSRLIYTASELASGGKGQGEAVSLTEHDYGGSLGLQLFTEYQWIPVDEPIPDHEGFIVGNEEQYLFIPMDSDLIVAVHSGEKDVYRLETFKLPAFGSSDEAFEHSKVMLDTYSGSTVSAIGLTIQTTESDVDKIAEEMADAWLQNHMVQEDINIYKISDYEIIEIEVESDDETSPDEIAIYVRTIVVPYKEENTIFWYRGHAGSVWEEADEFYDMPVIFHQLLWQKEGHQWICINSGTGGINVN